MSRELAALIARAEGVLERVEALLPPPVPDPNDPPVLAAPPVPDPDSPPVPAAPSVPWPAEPPLPVPPLAASASSM